MENAINGMAGAINSIKEGNEKGYERAYDAFKTNVKLADQRLRPSTSFIVMHCRWAALIRLPRRKMRNAATRFGDSQMLMLAEHGMIKEVMSCRRRGRSLTSR